MTRSRIRFYRHGQSAANVNNLIANRGDGPALTDVGRVQMRGAADTIRNERVTRIISSPMLRAKQSAEVFEDAFGVSADYDEDLREYDLGELEGRSDNDAWDAYWRLSDAWLLDGDAAARIPGGESLLDIQGRFQRSVERLLETPTAGTTIVVAHAGLYRCAFPGVFSNISTSFVRQHELGNAENVVAEHSGQLPLDCISWAPHDAALVGDTFELE